MDENQMKEIEEMGVKIAHVTLHVGLGTFRPVKAEDILDHEMHSLLLVPPAPELWNLSQMKTALFMQEAAGQRFSFILVIHSKQWIA